MLPKVNIVFKVIWQMNQNAISPISQIFPKAKGPLKVQTSLTQRRP